MNPGWSVEAGRLACRWSGIMERRRYTPAWFHGASPGAFENTAPPIPDFAAHSPLGSGEWIAPWRARWSLPTPSSI